MSKAEKRKYTKEFGTEVDGLVLAQEMTLDEAGASLALPKGTLANRVSAAKRGDGTTTMANGRTVSKLEAEVARLREELTNTNVEVEILKKASAYFARESLPGTRK